MNRNFLKTILFIVSSIFISRGETGFVKTFFIQIEDNPAYKIIGKSVIMTSSEVEQQKDRNQNAEKLFQKNPKGRDEPSKNHELGQVWLKYIYKTGKYAPTESLLLFKDFIINENSFYTYDSESSYRGIENSLSLDEIPDTGDDLENGQCCENIGEISEVK